MSQTYTATQTDTSTYSEARARVVMLSVLEDLVVLASSNKISFDKAKSWMEDLLYLLKARVLNYFELQCCSRKGARIGGYKYTLSDDGSLHENSPSGGIDPHDLPEGTNASLFAYVDYSKSNKNEVIQYLSQRGWGTNGTPLGGQPVYEKAYSKDGYGLQRYKIAL